MFGLVLLLANAWLAFKKKNKNKKLDQGMLFIENGVSVRTFAFVLRINAHKIRSVCVHRLWFYSLHEYPTRLKRLASNRISLYLVFHSFLALSISLKCIFYWLVLTCPYIFFKFRFCLTNCPNDGSPLFASISFELSLLNAIWISFGIYLRFMIIFVWSKKEFVMMEAVNIG